jgi:N-acetylmuramoyl-L-alanine amidase
VNRREALQSLAALVASGAATLSFAAPKVLAVRAWPGRNSTRVTIESDEELRFFVTTLANPDRAIVDLTDVRADQTFQQALESLKSDTGVVLRGRIGQFRPDTARLVLELKGSAETAAFALPPVGQYRHRLVIDLTPADSDPIAEFLTKLAERESQLDRMQQEAAKGGAIGSAVAEKTPPKAPSDNVAQKTPPKAPNTGATSPPASAKPTRPFVVVLDPGHGGEDPGAIGPAGTYEKTVVLAIAQKAKFLLEQDKRFVVFMTRDEDVFVPLGERVKKARSVNADVFVSIHADAFTRREARGSSVYALSERGASSAAARWIADKENQSDLIGGVRLRGRDPELAKMILEMNQSITNADSAKLGGGVLSEIRQVNRMHKERLEFANFAVLRAPDVPSILIETAFISNPEEERRLASDAHQLRLARAIRSGIRRFLSQQTIRT